MGFHGHSTSNARRPGHVHQVLVPRRSGEGSPQWSRKMARTDAQARTRSGVRPWRSFKPAEEWRADGGRVCRRQQVEHRWSQWHRHAGHQRGRVGAGIVQQMLRRRCRVVLMNGTGAAVVIMVVVRLAVEVHHRMLELRRIGQGHGRARLGQRLPAQTEDQQEGDERVTQGARSLADAPKGRMAGPLPSPTCSLPRGLRCAERSWRLLPPRSSASARRWFSAPVQTWAR